MNKEIEEIKSLFQAPIEILPRSESKESPLEGKQWEHLPTKVESVLDLLGVPDMQLQETLPQESSTEFEDDNPAEVYLEGEHTFLIVPDTHYWDKNIAGRTSYIDECWENADNVYSAIVCNEDITDVLFAGDVFHKGFQDIDNLKAWVQYFAKLQRLLHTRGGQIYSVIGNHEYSFMRNNPFWMLIGLFFKTPEIIHIGERSIFLDTYPSVKAMHSYRGQIHADVCVTHTEVLEPEVVEDIKKGQGRPVWLGYHASNFNRFDVKFLFCGHLHLTTGVYVSSSDDANQDVFTGEYKFGDIDITAGAKIVQYLGSLGRTNVTEIMDDFLERTLPVVKVGSGGVSVRQEKLFLKDYAHTVVESEIMVARMKRAVRKEYLEIKQEAVSSDPIQKLRERYASNPVLLTFFDGLIDGQKPELLLNAILECERSSLV